MWETDLLASLEHTANDDDHWKVQLARLDATFATRSALTAAPANPRRADRRVDARPDGLFQSCCVFFPALTQPEMPSLITNTFVYPKLRARPAPLWEACQPGPVQ
ncbi:MAG: hypothetical protein H6Q90_4928 [Deltaproteobacteria bacterium]|nr:hypothetical protein [Deltaproteobacteria bacterium]